MSFSQAWGRGRIKWQKCLLIPPTSQSFAEQDYLGFFASKYLKYKGVESVQ